MKVNVAKIWDSQNKFLQHLSNNERMKNPCPTKK